MPIKDGNLASQEKIYDAFFSATDAQEIEQLIPLLNDFYYQLKMDEKGKCISQEKITPLEIAAEEGKLAQVNALLKFNTPKKLSRELLTSRSIHHEDCAAFFRALENGHTHVVSRLFEQPSVSTGILDIKIKPTPSGLDNRTYIDSIQKPKYYPILYSRIPPQGNVALVMAAGLSKSEIFNTLLKIDALKHQLEESALVSLFSATMQMNGLRKPKEDINQEIINQLFNIPSVYAYALTREFDFGELIAKYHDSKTETTLGFKQRFLLKINEGNPSAEETDVESSSALESNRSNSEENASDTSSTDDSCVAKTWH